MYLFKHGICLLLLFAAAVCLTGCLEIDIDTGIDGRFSSYLAYEIKMDTGTIPHQYREIAASALNNLGWYYQEHYGFSVGVDDSPELFTLNMKKSIANSNMAEAFASLKSLLTDENITPLSEAEIELLSLPRIDSYIAGAMVDIPQIIKLANTDDLPPDLAADMQEALKEGTGTITLTLPVSEIVGNTHETVTEYRLAKMTVPLSFTEQTRFELRGRVIYSQDGMQIDNIETMTEGLEQTKLIIAAACAAALLILLIILITVLIRIKRHNSFYK